LTIDVFNEHDRLAWQLFPCMVEVGEGMWTLPPDTPSLPLAFSLRATRK
jgi:hypothetical protein